MSRKLDDPVYFASGSLLDFWTNAVETFHITSAVSSLSINRNVLYALWPTIKRRFGYYSHAKAVLYIPLKAEPKSLSVSRSAHLGFETLSPGGAHDQIL